MSTIEKEIVDKFLQAQNHLVIQSSDLSLESIANMVEIEAIDISPKYQRRERWSPVRQSALIESFLLNIPVPPVFLAEDEFGKYSVIDGKQRITAINNFIKKKMRLNSLQRFKEIENFSFEELPPQLANALKIRPYIRVITLLKQSEPQLKYEVFTRLNTGGESLSPQEIRNVAYRGSLNDLIYKLSENVFLKKQLKITSKQSESYRKMVDAEYVLRFFTLYEKWDSFSGNMKDAMDQFMRDHVNIDKKGIDKYRLIFETTISICEQIWGKTSFMRPDGSSFRNQILQGVYDAQMIPIALFLPKYKDKMIAKGEKIRQAFLIQYRDNDDFENSIRQFTSNPERVIIRIKTMIDEINKIIA